MRKQHVAYFGGEKAIVSRPCFPPHCLHSGSTVLHAISKVLNFGMESDSKDLLDTAFSASLISAVPFGKHWWKTLSLAMQSKLAGQVKPASTYFTHTVSSQAGITGNIASLPVSCCKQISFIQGIRNSHYLALADCLYSRLFRSVPTCSHLYTGRSNQIGQQMHPAI